MLFPSFTRRQKIRTPLATPKLYHPSLTHCIESLENRCLLSAQLTVTNTADAGHPDTIDFGDVLVKHNSPGQSFVLSNPGDATLHVTNFAFTDPGNDLFVMDDTGADIPAAFNIDAGATFKIDVIYNPDSVGRRTQDYTFNTDGSDPGDAGVTLHTTGNGVQAPTPAAPGQFSANTVDASHIQLQWHDTDSGVTGFHIYQSTNANSGYQLIKTVGSGAQSFAASGLHPSTHYYFRISAYNDGGDSPTAQDDDVTASTPSVGGRTIAAAKNLGAVVGRKRINSAVNDSHKSDFFKITLSKKTVLHAKIDNLSADADLELYNSAKHKIGSSENDGPDSITKTLPAGVYYVQVVQGNAGNNAAYTLTLAPDFAGNNIRGSLNLGTITKRRVIADSIAPDDASDYYKIVLDKRRLLSLTLNGLSDDADLELYNARGTKISSSENSDTTPENIKKALAAGIYYVQVTQGGSTSDTAYKLSLTAV